MDLLLGGRTVVVTGASSGVGLATTALLLAEGAHVAACARDLDRLRAALAPLPRAAGARLLTGACDVLDAAPSPSSSARPPTSWAASTGWSTTRAAR